MKIAINNKKILYNHYKINKKRRLILLFNKIIKMTLKIIN